MADEGRVSQRRSTRCYLLPVGGSGKQTEKREGAASQPGCKPKPQPPANGTDY